VLALVRGLVEWVPTSAAWAGYVAGPLVLVGYLAGALAATVEPPRREAVAAAVTLLVSTVAWDVGLEASPRGAFGAVGTYSNQALGAWVSIALWTGTAAVIGAMAPVFTGFRRGSSGVAPAAAMLVAFMPLLAFAGGGVGAIAWAAGATWRVVLAVALAAIVVVEYLAWVTDTQLAWGITNGPELGLWCAVLAVVILGRSAGDA
jgi:hypothetical protein